MKTNLVYFSNCTPQQKMAIHKFLPSFTYGTFSSIVSKTELVTFADVGDIKNALTSSSIIALDFSDDALFRKVQSALSQYYHTSVKKIDGYAQYFILCMRKQHHGIHTRPHLSRQIVQRKEATVIRLSILLLCQLVQLFNN